MACSVSGGGPVASEYLTSELGYPVNIPVARVSLRWWGEAIAQERAKREASLLGPP